MEAFDRFADIVATATEALMIVILIIGALQAVASLPRLIRQRAHVAVAVRVAWPHYAAWILLALEFALAADLIRTVVAPTWNEVGKLATIAAIRTALGFFLGRDIEEFREADTEPAGEP